MGNCTICGSKNWPHCVKWHDQPKKGTLKAKGMARMLEVSRQQLAEARDAARYRKLRGLLMANQPGPWGRVCNIASAGVLNDEDEFDRKLDNDPGV